MGMSRTRVALAVLVVTTASFTPAIARAQKTSVADALYREGQDLLREGKVELACAKLAESYRIEPALGTLINLALCHEKAGRTASAWTEFADATAQAARLGQRDREEFARLHASTLEPQVFFLVVEVPSPVDGLEVKLDAVGLGKAAWGSSLPLDPGEHIVTASRPGKRAWSATVTAAGARRERIAVPKLEDPQAETGRREASPAVRSEPLSPAGATYSTRRTVGFVGLGVGAVGIGVGAVFGIIALGKKSDVDNLCTGTSCATGGTSSAADARSAALISTIGFGVGVAAAALGTYLVLSSKHGNPALRVSPSFAGLQLDGAF